MLVGKGWGCTDALRALMRIELKMQEKFLRKVLHFEILHVKTCLQLAMGIPSLVTDLRASLWWEI